jgi:DNA transposition AAA+ family ATPase
MVRERLKKLMEERGLSQYAVARGTGMSPASVNQYLQDKYPGPAKNIEEKVVSFLERKEAEGKIVPRPGFVQTSVAKKIHKIMKDAGVEGDLAVITGPSGVGKTTAIDNFAKQDQTVVLVKADVSFSVGGIVEEIAEALGISTRGRIRVKVKRVINALKNSGRLLIIDEAELLNVKSLEILRKIYDETKCGMVLSGMPRLWEIFDGGLYEQLRSRVGARLQLGRISRADVKMLIDVIEPKVDDRVVGKIAEMSGGSARVAVKLTRKGKRTARDLGKALNIEMVEQAEAVAVGL